METIKYWHSRDEIWELNSHACAFSVPNPRGPPEITIWLCCTEVGACVTFTWLTDTSVGCGTAAEVSDLKGIVSLCKGCF